MTTDTINQLEALRERAQQELASVSDLDGLDRWRAAYLGRSVPLSDILRQLGSLPAEERRPTGQRANEVKQALEQAFAARQEALRSADWQRALETDRVDVTLPGRRPPQGRLHPTTLILQRISEIFIGMGYQVVEGPEVERDYYNFEALNIPPDHPARDMWDTFYIQPPEVLLRTHTSPMQV